MLSGGAYMSLYFDKIYDDVMQELIYITNRINSFIFETFGKRLNVLSDFGDLIFLCVFLLGIALSVYIVFRISVNPLRKLFKKSNVIDYKDYSLLFENSLNHKSNNLVHHRKYIIKKYIFFKMVLISSLVFIIVSTAIYIFAMIIEFALMLIVRSKTLYFLTAIALFLIIYILLPYLVLRLLYYLVFDTNFVKAFSKLSKKLKNMNCFKKTSMRIIKAKKGWVMYE